MEEVKTETENNHEETMKDVEDILEASLEKVVDSIKEEEESDLKEDEITEQEPETFWYKVKNSPPFIQLGISLGLVSVVAGVYLFKK